ncbi:hypothetical protein PLICRDRAFT_172114 [Plicaturopsis crispa FD-325 SS-3]|nr:hypothetical protein PLICRDRAFT_172114 [Plicaturopsis crispa FD-325 SS-3]
MPSPLPTTTTPTRTTPSIHHGRKRLRPPTPFHTLYPHATPVARLRHASARRQRHTAQTHNDEPNTPTRIVYPRRSMRVRLSAAWLHRSGASAQTPSPTKKPRGRAHCACAGSIPAAAHGAPVGSHTGTRTAHDDNPRCPMPTTGSAWGESRTAMTVVMRDPYDEERGGDEGGAAGRDEGGAAGKDAAGQACEPSSSTPSRSATAGGAYATAAPRVSPSCRPPSRIFCSVF